ncbi:ATP-binding protein [Vitiosangium sp. GDMCC 1.1324]|uniref:sensor histidine kinase n=1 Tax=Vitiosangium sp. (strain GDMCC 1.1324) TaxID=2138576 RepID=UPI001E63B95E|nr:ATP-binding protein [Vitiosangium sp. GDMCC 1.1324]
MRLCDFIRVSQSLILAEWEREARSHPYSQGLSRPRLLDHLPDLLDRMANMVETLHTGERQSMEGLPEVHALERLEVGYDLEQVAHEYALLRACILRLYEVHAEQVGMGEPAVMLREVRRFNQIFDAAVSTAVTCYARTRERTLVALDRISEAALGTEVLDTFLPKLLRVILESTESVDSVTLMLREENTLRMRASVGVEEALDAGFRLQVGEGFVGKVAAERRPLELHAAATDPLVKNPVLRARSIRALYGVPLSHGSDVIGVATMSSLTAASFSTEDKLLFRTMVQRISALLFQARLQEREQSQRRLLDAILTQLPVGVAVAEAPSGHLILGNQAFEDIWRHPFIHSPDLEGYRKYRGIHPDGRPFEPQEWPIARALQGEVVHAMEICILRGDGTRGVTLQNSAPLRDAQGRIIAAVVTALDITDHKAAEEQQRRTVEFRERFLGIVSHDLRNPLNAVRLSAEAILKSGSTNPGQARNARRILGSTERMRRMIADLLDFTRGQLGGGIPVNRQPVELLQLTRHVLEELETGHPGRVFRLEASGQFLGEWDPDRFAQVLGNLGKNALDYSPEGTPVDFRLRDEGATVCLEVHNEGAPIPAHELPYIFEPYQRAATGRGHSASGLGLGLFIVQQIVQAHGGTITVHSTEAEGTTFAVRLPRYGARHERSPEA